MIDKQPILDAAIGAWADCGYRLEEEGGIVILTFKGSHVADFISMPSAEDAQQVAKIHWGRVMRGFKNCNGHNPRNIPERGML